MMFLPGVFFNVLTSSIRSPFARTVCSHADWLRVSEFGLVGVLPGLGAFWLICGSAFHDDAHGAFMTLPPYTRTREGETRQLEEWSELPPGGPLSYEMLTEHG